jgi:hypothetical protein
LPINIKKITFSNFNYKRYIELKNIPFGAIITTK